ncbi:MAG: prepilin peptidase [Clostridiales bacterium]|nr:prepilin peptidase [Clostridiales bacterium]
MNYFGMIGLFLLLLLCTIEDIRKKKIIIWHLLLVVPFLIVDIIFNTIVTCNLSWIERLCGLGIGMIFMVLSKLTKGQVGMGDGYLIAVFGIMLGAWRNLEIITYSFLASAVISIILLSFFHFGKKRTIPFIPFLFFGFLCSFFLGGSTV